MPKSLIELHEERGRLRERIAAQRQTLAQQLAPLNRTLQTGDRLLATGRSIVDELLQHPLALAVLAAVAVALRPRTIWRWGRRGLLLWRGWRLLDRWLPDALARWLGERPQGRR